MLLISASEVRVLVRPSKITEVCELGGNLTATCPAGRVSFALFARSWHGIWRANRSHLTRPCIRNTNLGAGSSNIFGRAITPSDSRRIFNAIELPCRTTDASLFRCGETVTSPGNWQRDLQRLSLSVGSPRAIISFLRAPARSWLNKRMKAWCWSRSAFL